METKGLVAAKGRQEAAEPAPAHTATAPSALRDRHTQPVCHRLRVAGYALHVLGWPPVSDPPERPSRSPRLHAAPNTHLPCSIPT